MPASYHVDRGLLRRAPAALLAAALAACGGGGEPPTQANQPPPPPTGSLSLATSGLPAGASVSFTVTAPGGANSTVPVPATLSGLQPGTYTVTAPMVTISEDEYAPTPATQSVQVQVGATARAIEVVYAVVTGRLLVDVQGLPAGSPGAVQVSGPDGFSQTVTTTRTLAGLRPGTYTVTAAEVSAAGATYTASPASLQVNVAAGVTATATVIYTASIVTPGGFNLTVDGAYLVQSVQRYSGTVPLVAGRDAYLRVFVKANQTNTVAPAVRVRFYRGAALAQTYTIGAPTGSVPTTVSEASLSRSWNVRVPADLVQPGLRLLVDVDPANAVTETDEADNQFPISGAPLDVDVRTVPTFPILLVPVIQRGNNAAGDVTAANASSYLTLLRRMYPIVATSVTVHAPFTTSTSDTLEANDNNGAWGRILNEVLALRQVEQGVPQTAPYYYGVVRTGYLSGVAGLGYVPGTPSSSYKAAIGWDYAGSRAEILAHEVGHNFGRLHAPCGGAANPDPAFPYPNGSIGVFGLDLESLAIKNPSNSRDIMGYCNNDWVSDYTFEAVLAFRSASPNGAPPASGADSSLLVWGRIMPRGLVLEPALVVAEPPPPLPQGGNERIEGLDDAGATLFSVNFDAAQVPDLPAGIERHFAFRLPYSATMAARLAAIRLVAGGRVAEQRVAAVTGPRFVAPPTAAATHTAGGGVRLTWDASRHPMVLVRDGASGEVLAFARTGAATVYPRSGVLELSWSNGVGGPVERIRVQ